MPVDSLTPTDPTLGAAIADIAAGLASAFRPAINTQKNSLLADAQRVMALLEKLDITIGNGAISGGTMTAGAGLSVSVAAYSAICGGYLSYSSSQTVGGLNDNTTNNVYLRQDGTWTITTGSSVPNAADGHGAYLLWGTATTSGGAVTGVTNTRDTFRLMAPLAQQRDTIRSGETVWVGLGQQTQLFGSLSVQGRLTVDGKVRITA